MLAEELTEWPADTWLVIDDYQHVAAMPEAERFIEILVRTSPLRALVCSRCRPSWVTPRDVLYGEVLELSQTALAMTHDEASELLCDWREEQVVGLMALADGWPAVIGFAGAAPSPDDLAKEVPTTLLEYFADEILQASNAPSRLDLERLLLYPVIDVEAAHQLLGSRARSVISEAIRTGILEERGEILEFHPIARRALESSPALSDSDRAEAVNQIIALLTERRDWDSLFALCASGHGAIHLASLLEKALPELLGAARLTTVERWLALRGSDSSEGPAETLARGELSIRKGHHKAARVFAERALRSIGESGDLAYEALSLAGRAAHVGCRELEALDYYQRAEAVAPEPSQRREAQWSQVMCASTLELDEARLLLSDLGRHVSPDDTRELIRMVDKRLSVGLKFGEVTSLEDARQCVELLPELRDPVARCSFRSVYSYGLALSCDYEEALVQADELLLDAREYRFDIAVPYALTTRAVALAGMKNYELAHIAINQARATARKINDIFGLQNAYAIEVRTLLQQNHVANACAIEPPEGQPVIMGIWAEAQASRALALACLGRYGEAAALAEEARTSSRGIEARVLAAGVDAIVAIKTGASSCVDAAAKLVEDASASKGFDLLVSCYRASPDLLDALLRERSTQERMVYLLRRVDDLSIADELGHEPLEALSPFETLSPRELEIYACLVQGLSNREIGRRLFIAPSTVKIHVRHVYDKLGVRSRRALILAARRWAS
jgi:DNA-binding NarL/FixJ family response regulator